MTNLVAMVLSGSCEHVDSVVITESVDCSTYESAETQTAMGFSQPPDTPGLADSVRRESEVFAESAAMMANAMGVVLDQLTFDVTFTAATGDSDLGFMHDPGRDGRRRDGLPPRVGAASKNVVSVGFNWMMGEHTVPPKPLAHGHVIQVFGLPNMRTVLHCLPPEDWTEPGFMGLGMIYTAMPVTNAVPYVVAARAGHRHARRPAARHRAAPGDSSVHTSCRSPAAHGHGIDARQLAAGPLDEPRVVGQDLGTEPGRPPRPARRRGTSRSSR